MQINHSVWKGWITLGPNYSRLIEKLRSTIVYDVLMHMTPKLNILIVLSCSDIRIKLYLALHFYTVALDDAIENKCSSYCSYVEYVQFVYWNGLALWFQYILLYFHGNACDCVWCPYDLANEFKVFLFRVRQLCKTQKRIMLPFASLFIITSQEYHLTMAVGEPFSLCCQQIVN